MDRPTHLARRLAALADMGFERVEAHPVLTESVRVGRNRFKVTCTRPAMGTLVAVTALDGSKQRAEEAMGLAFQEMDRVIGLLNRYDRASALSHLNTEGAIDGAPPELSEVTLQALRLNELSRGAFDVTVQPLVDLFRSRAAPTDPGEAPPRPPTPGEVQDVLERVDGSAIEVRGRGIRFGKPRMGITLDGIAKGYIVDGMANRLSTHGIRDYLINAGGDIRSAGSREDGSAWRVGVQEPDGGQSFPDVVELSDGAVATSGSYEIYFDRERTLHHIVSSRTGASPQLSESVSVTAPSAADADALATSVFVMGPERGVAFIDSLPRCACLIVDREGRRWSSRRWKSASNPRTRKAGT
jgi:thiamine biosynthesis lipoprotein